MYKAMDQSVTRVVDEVTRARITIFAICIHLQQYQSVKNIVQIA